ncbi:hypothetical protein Tco_0548826 [Tanacetum coccineum]
MAETIAAQRKFRAAQRSAEIRSRPPTKSQLRNLMMTYLKNMGGYKHYQLKTKTFKEIQGMYERQKRSINDFKPMDLDDAVKDSEKTSSEDTSKKKKVLEEPDSTKVKAKEEGHKESGRKRSGRRLKMKETKKSKRQKTDSDLEDEEQLRTFINGTECIFYKIFRSDGSSRWIKTFFEMVTLFDRMNLEELYTLVMKRFETTTPEGVDLVLWGALKTMFEANADDDLWKNQEEWILKSWNLYDNCGVHILMLENGIEFYMLAERKYPLTKETLERMLALRLIAEMKVKLLLIYLDLFKRKLMSLETMMGKRRIFNKELASPKKMTLGKDVSNPLIVDSLLKTIWLSMHHVIAMKHWLFQSKRLLNELVAMRLKANLRHEQSTKKHDEVMNMRDKFKKKNSPEVESTKGFRSYDDISFEMLETSATRDKKNLKEGANFFGSKKVEFETSLVLNGTNSNF